MSTFSNLEIDDAFNRAPAVIQAFISDGESVSVIVPIGMRYKLHIDQIGKIAELNRNMLLGLVTPEEFLQELIVSKVPEADSKQIISEINQNIFVPLRDKLRKGGAAAIAPVKPTTETQPAATTPPRVSVPPAQVQMPVPNSVSPTMPKPPTPPVQAAIRPAPSPSVAPLPPKLVMPRPALHNNLTAMPGRPMLPLGEEPSALSPSVNLISRVPTSRPAEAFGVGGPPQSVAPKPPMQSTPVNLPGTNIPVPTQALRVAPAAPKAPTPIVKQYSSDPYREPIEEVGS